jgi:hemerythrin superfamily protein
MARTSKTSGGGKRTASEGRGRAKGGGAKGSRSAGGKARGKATTARAAGATRGKAAAKGAAGARKSAPKKGRSGGALTAGGAIFAALVSDHRTVSEALDQLKELTQKERPTSATDARCLAMFRQVYRDLTAHSKAEDQVVYTTVMERADEIDLVFEAREEHGLVERLLEELSGREEIDEIWCAKVKVLADLVEHHVEEEESELFAQMREALEKSELDALAEEFERTKAVMLDRLAVSGMNGKAGDERALHS